MHPVAKKILLYAVLPVSIACAVIFGVGSWYAQAYTFRIYPGVFVGPVDVGGLTQQEAAAKISTATREVTENGLSVSVENALVTIPLTTQGGNDPDFAIDLTSWNIDQAVLEAINQGRGSNPFVTALSPIIYGVFHHQTIPLPVTIQKDSLSLALFDAFPEASTPSQNAGFVVTPGTLAHTWDISVTASVDGHIIDTESLFTAMQSNLENSLYIPPLQATVLRQTAVIKLSDAEALIPQAKSLLENDPYTLTFAPENGSTTTWDFSASDIAPYLQPKITSSATIAIGLDQAILVLVNERTKAVIHPPADAKFMIVNGKVKEFQGARDGWIVNEQQTLASLEAAIHDKTAGPFFLQADYQPASVQTSDVNDLGISEVLGVGESNLSGSPANRVKNIQNGATLLNGTLIKPDDTFSLLTTLGPFTEENGYLPELVIKGDRIIPEIAGGLCQIGTTTFRGAMNAGLPIVERRNHSLVVSYYNDPRNNLPGTDATIYDPSPDLKFTNNTGHYVLITTDINTTTGALAFTFWGTSDGRKASYSEPIVSSWIPAGETKNIETLDLAPGTTKCQSKHPGANASFVYTLVNADGTTTEQTFTSSYRALPEICLVGVEKLSEPIDEAIDETSAVDPLADTTTQDETPTESTTSETTADTAIDSEASSSN